MFEESQGDPGSGSGSATGIIDDNGFADSGSDGAGDKYGELQDRMEDKDSPWYSPSVGKMLDAEGNDIVDPETGEPFRSKADFDKFLAKSNQQSAPKDTPKAKTENQPGEQAKSRAFSDYMSEVTPEKAAEIAQKVGAYKYNDSLVPKVAATVEGKPTEPPAAPVDPVEKLKEDRKVWEQIAVSPLLKVRQALIENGINQSALDELLSPIYAEQTKLVDGQYQQEYEKALEARLSAPLNEKQTALERKETESNAMNNIENLARQYFPAGKDAFFALINGHQDESGNWVRGEAAPIVDMLVFAASGGKEFTSADERASEYKTTFNKFMADPDRAQALVDFAYNYYRGKNIDSVKTNSYQAGKQAAQQATQRANKTYRTRPSNFSNTSEDNSHLPSQLQNALRTLKH